MRCISPHAKYSIQAFEGDEQIVVDARGYATRVVLKDPIVCNFDQGGLLDHEIAFALESFGFSGIPDGVNPLTRVSAFDTEAYVQRLPKERRDEVVVQLDERLRELEKLFPSEFRIVESPRAARPWPSYDEDSVEDILKFQERLRINPETIRLYEHENQHRQEIIDAMFLLEDPNYVPEGKGEGDTEVVVQA